MDLESTHGDVAWTVTAAGGELNVYEVTVLRSGDGGRTWEPAMVETSRPVDVTAHGQRAAVALGLDYAGLVRTGPPEVRTTEDGTRWSSRPDLTTERSPTTFDYAPDGELWVSGGFCEDGRVRGNTRIDASLRGSGRIIATALNCATEAWDTVLLSIDDGRSRSQLSGLADDVADITLHGWANDRIVVYSVEDEEALHAAHVNAPARTATKIDTQAVATGDLVDLPVINVPHGIDDVHVTDERILVTTPSGVLSATSWRPGHFTPFERLHRAPRPVLGTAAVGFDDGSVLTRLDHHVLERSGSLLP